MSTITFYFWLLVGTVVPAGEHEGHKVYTLWFKKENKVIDFAYKGEIINYIETGEFEYDELLEFEQ